MLLRILRAIGGILLIIVGIAALACPKELFIAMSWMWAFMMVGGGIVSIIVWFKVPRETPGRGFLLAGGIIEILLGLVMIGNGVVFTTIVALNVLQIWVIFSGITSIVSCFEEKRAGFKFWWLTLILGILMLIIGMSGFTSAVFNTTMLSMLVGLGLILSGGTFFLSAFGNKEA